MRQTKTDLQRLIRGAMGEIKADLIITGGQLVNVYSGEIVDGTEIAVLDGRICYLGARAEHARGDRTEILDARGLYVSPGFIDGHTHIGHYCRPFEHLQSYLPHGTTSLVASCDELSTVFGFRGLTVFLDEVEAHPLRVYTLASMVAPQDPLVCNTAAFTNDQIAEALANPRVLGMGEIVSWLRLIQGDEQLLERIEMAHRNRRIIHGHTAGARDQKLCAIAASGISSCHEPIRVEDALERIRLGYWTMLREGSLRQDLEATLKPLIVRGVSLERLILVTDSMSPDDVQEHGHMDHVLRRAISLGLAPIQAIQAVTLHPATYSGLDQEIGGIAPGRFADMVLLTDLERFVVHSVLVGGKVMARGGESLVESAPITLPADLFKSLHLRPGILPERFKIASPRRSPKIRVMELVNQTITRERILTVNTADGYLEADLSQDLLKVAMFDRHGPGEQITLGFLRGLGAKVGAVGLTTNLDENTLLVAGSSDEDMALCANVLIESGGGIAVVKKGIVAEKLEFPLGGIFSLDPWQDVGMRLSRIQRRLREDGSRFEKPVFALSFLPFVTLPSLRITSRGLVNAKERKIVSLFVD
ncbi:MAG: adenine deaminase C-terminal domain-containing protein [Candidatus Binatia bacterium]